MNSQIYNFFFITFVLIVVKTTKHEENFYVLNLLLLLQIKLVSHINNHINSFNINN